MITVAERRRSSTPWYRWPLIVLGLHTAFVGFVFCIVLSGVRKGTRDAEEFGGIALLIDLPSGLLIIPAFAVLERAFGAPLNESFAGIYSPATFFAVVGGVQYFGLTALIVWRTRRATVRRLAAEGRCIQCGYNLTGLPERRCPECGRTF